MKYLLRVVLPLLCVSATYAFASSVTLGTMQTNECIPFMCNGSGQSVGLSIDYQEAYISTGFPGPFNITDISWQYFPHLGSPVQIGGTYTFYWGYSAVGLALTTSLPSNYSGAANLIATTSVPPGGFNFGTTLTLTGFTPFTYNPAKGDLILEVVVTNQAPVVIGSGNGYNWADFGASGQVMRAWCYGGGGGCTAADIGALVTTFSGTPVTVIPEPRTLVTLGTGLLGLAGLLGRKLNL